VQRIIDIEGGTLQGLANPRRSAAIPRMILSLYLTYFNTSSRRDGVYHEAATTFESCNEDLELMLARPVRSTICIHLSSFAALQIVVQFDDRIEGITSNIFCLPSMAFYLIVIQHFRNSPAFCPEYSHSKH
jgi:hypothetical protein